MEKLEEYKWSVLKGLTMSLFFLYFFIKGRLLGGSDFYNLLNLTFGVYYFFLILYPLLLVSSVFLGDKRKESVLRIRLYTGILFFFFCTFFTVIEELKLYTIGGVSLEQQLVKISWEEINLGGAATSIMHFLYFNVEETLLYRGVLLCIFITGFILLAKMFTESIRSIFRTLSRRRERKELQKKERELLEKISIKEEIDKKMNLKKQKNLRQQEEKIKQEVDKFIKEGETKEKQPKEDETLSLDNLMEKKQSLEPKDESKISAKELNEEDSEGTVSVVEETQGKGEANDTSV